MALHHQDSTSKAPVRSPDTIAATSVPSRDTTVILLRESSGTDYVALAGVVTTAIISGWALWLSFKSRRNSLQDRVHGAQFDVVQKMMPDILAALRHAVNCNTFNSNGDAEAVRQELKASSASVNLQNHLVLASVILPDSLVSTFRAFMQSVRDCAKPMTPEEVPPKSEALKARFGALSKEARRVLGIDVLTSDVQDLLGIK